MKNFSMTAPNIIQPIIAGRPTFKRKPIVLQDKVTRWRGIADMVNLSDKGHIKLEWMIFYETAGYHNAYTTARHFNIAPKTFYKWHKRFDNGKVRKLEDENRRPKTLRSWEVTGHEECRIMKLRKSYMYWGKTKIKKLYETEYGETISSWKVGRVIQEHNLYPDKAKAEKQRNKLKNASKKNRIQKLIRLVTK